MIIEGAKACQKYGRRLKIKKGQFMSPEDTENIVNKAKHFIGLDDILLTERGTSFGYRNLIVDMASYGIMKSFGVQVIHDATHCVQRPGALGNQSGGKKEQIVTLARAAIAAGADGIFMEAHPSPKDALSDSATVVDLKNVKTIVKELIKIKNLVSEFSS